MLRPLLFIFCAATALALPTHVTAANACAAPGDSNAIATEIVNGVNQTRRARGLPPLGFNQRLAQASQDHACDMAIHAIRGHRGSDGSNAQLRARARGYRACTIAENVAWDFPRVAQVVNGWNASPGHLSNILHPRVSEMGVGVAQGAKGPTYVLVLGQSC
ncbi:CAP domain-containing protein [Loktanella sp. 3ANDIMAR09]|uniref:CAP domain-containing protein n=1 Tax=Loktanella sp. 3ANDIMAR09 TaxID=1225657 RepID=UPI0006F410DA|nr:CAP domain-containing protein [Loktanella sp. 3ANDIMAR09]